MMQQLDHWYQTNCLNEEGKLRSGIKWVLRAGGIIALGCALTCCGNNWRMYESPGANEMREYTVDMDHFKENTFLIEGYCAQNSRVKEEVKNYVEDYIAKAQRQQKIKLHYHPVQVQVQDPLSHPCTKKILYFIDHQSKPDGIITEYEVQKAKENIDALLE